MSRVLNLILAHQPASQLDPLLRWWSNYSAPEDILVAYGGTMENFKALPEIPRIFVGDPRLRTKDLQRDKQSYGGIWRGAADYLAGPPQQDFTHVYFAEYDHLPLVPDLAAKLLARMKSERADILAHHLRQIDGTVSDFYLYHAASPDFATFWQKVSRRTDKNTVLQMQGSASFWTREAFIKVAQQPESILAYMEIYLPTLAHHLGFRIRDLGEQNEFVRHAPFKNLTIENARQKGSWTIHPVKKLPPSNCV